MTLDTRLTVDQHTATIGVQRDPDEPPPSITTTSARVERSAITEIGDWGRRYLQAHPLTALGTVGGQVVLGLRTIEYLVLDVLTARFPLREFISQAAFMAATALIPTLFVTIPIGVTLSIQFSLLAGQVGATSYPVQQRDWSSSAKAHRWWPPSSWPRRSDRR